MYSLKIGAILATAAGCLALAGSAQAQISGTIGGDVVDTDALQVLSDPEVTFDGDVAFTWTNGKVGSHLTGKMHVVGGVNASYRVKVESFDRAGSSVGTSYDDKDGTGVHSADVEIPVDMDASSAPYVAQVRVTLQKKGTGDKFNNRASESKNLNLHDDSVTLLGDGIDVGSGPFGYTGPMFGAPISWKINNNGQLTSTYDGVEFFDGFSRCGRVVLRSLSATGLQLDEVKGPEYCPVDNGFYRDPQTLATPASALANGVEVAMQSKTGGNWQDVSTERVTIAE
jgi:hypothetical protein